MRLLFPDYQLRKWSTVWLRHSTALVSDPQFCSEIISDYFSILKTYQFRQSGGQVHIEGSSIVIEYHMEVVAYHQGGYNYETKR